MILMWTFLSLMSSIEHQQQWYFHFTEPVECGIVFLEPFFQGQGHHSELPQELIPGRLREIGEGLFEGHPAARPLQSGFGFGGFLRVGPRWWPQARRRELWARE